MYIVPLNGLPARSSLLLLYTVSLSSEFYEVPSWNGTINQVMYSSVVRIYMALPAFVTIQTYTNMFIIVEQNSSVKNEMVQIMEKESTVHPHMFCAVLAVCASNWDRVFFVFL